MPSHDLSCQGSVIAVGMLLGGRKVPIKFVMGPSSKRSHYLSCRFMSRLRTSVRGTGRFQKSMYVPELGKKQPIVISDS